MALASVVLYTDTHRLTGTVNAGGYRLSDWFNAPHSEYLELIEPRGCSLLTPEDSPSTSPLLVLRKAHLRVAVLGDARHPYSPARVLTRQHPIALTLGLFEVRGHWHQRAGTSPNLVSLLSGYGRQFVPLTDAQVRYYPDPRFTTAAPIVLVNAHAVTFGTVEQPEGASRAEPAFAPTSRGAGGPAA
jgi:hypothetical protein